MLGSVAVWVSAAWLAAAPTPKDEASKAEPPRLVLAGGPMVGPHAIGNEECRPEAKRCETRGSFFGAGVNVEARLRLIRSLSLHVRPWVVGNLAPDKVYNGGVGAALGLGLYGKRIFARGEYIALHTWGDANFTPPFFEGEVASDDFGNHAGMVSVGFRQPVTERLKVELWGGPMFGPSSRRSYPDGEVDDRTLVTFMLGLGLSFDVR